MALGLFYVDRPKLGGSLVILIGIMMGGAVVVEDNGAPSEMFITLHGRRVNGHLGRVLFPCALKCGGFIDLRGTGFGKTYLGSMALRSAPQCRGWGLLVLPLWGLTVEPRRNR